MNYHEAIEYLDLRADERGAVALSTIELAVTDLRAALEAAIPVIEAYERLVSDMARYGDELYGSESGEWLATAEDLCAVLEQARAVLVETERNEQNEMDD